MALLTFQREYNDWMVSTSWQLGLAIEWGSAAIG